MECATGEQRRKSRAVRPSATDWIAAYSVPCTPRSEHRRATAPRSGGDAWPPQEAPTRCSARSVAAGLFIGGATLARGPPHTPPVRVTLRRFPKLSTLLSRPQGQGAFDGPLDSENGCVTTRSGSAADLDTTLGRLQLAHARCLKPCSLPNSFDMSLPPAWVAGGILMRIGRARRARIPNRGPCDRFGFPSCETQLRVGVTSCDTQRPARWRPASIRCRDLAR